MATITRRSIIQTFGIILLSIVTLPVSLYIIFAAYLAQLVTGNKSAPAKVQDGHPRRTVLVTGVGMAKGLTLARAFYQCGHRVIGADFEEHGIPCSGRFSHSLSAFYTLPKPSPAGDDEDENTYTRRLLDITASENVDLWVSCSGVATAAEDAQAKEAIEEQTGCRCIQFDEKTTMRLHEKDSFIRETRRLGLPVPETHEVTSHKAALEILQHSDNTFPDRKYIMKPVGMNDAHRGDMTLLPLATWSATERHVLRLPVSAENPWILQQFIPGGREYCTHALIVEGKVKVFVACPSSELLMHYEALPPSEKLAQEMLEFTQDFAARSPEPAGMTGHMSFDFMVEGDLIYAIECNPRVHTAVVLFAQQGGTVRAMVDAYLAALESPKVRDSTLKVNGDWHDLVRPSFPVKPRYWVGHDLVTLGVLPAIRAFLGIISVRGALHDLSELVSHLLTWKEGTFEVWDPLPALVLYHVYWPLTIAAAWLHGRRWSRVNVSTTKMFML